MAETGKDKLGRFSETDKEGLEAFVRILEEACDW